MIYLPLCPRCGGRVSFMDGGCPSPRRYWCWCDVCDKRDDVMFFGATLAQAIRTMQRKTVLDTDGPT